MTKIQLNTVINATREKVWHTMLDEATYREWASAFSQGSHYVGDLTQEGSKILFLGPSPTGEGEGGMVSIVKESRPYEFISINHIGVYGNGVEDTESETAKEWAGFENYTFTENGTGTELFIEVDVPESEKAFMEEAWSKGLAILKELAEK